MIFYAKGGGAFTWLMLGVDRLQLLDGDRRRPRARRRPARRGWLAFAVTVNLVVLGIFKYANFFADNVNALLLARDTCQPLAVPRVLLPIGISFFTFHAISYVIDVYAARRDRAEEPGARGALPAALPAADRRPDHPLPRHRRPARAARRVDRRLRLRRAPLRRSASRKKVLIANVVAGPADKIFGMPAGRAVRRARLARHRLLHAADLLRLLRLLGHGDRPRPDVRLPLSRELPLAVRRRPASGVLAALAHLAVDLVPRLPLHPARRQPRQPGAPLRATWSTVFFLCGLWHGASWNFVIWGLWHGVVPRDRAPARHRAIDYRSPDYRNHPMRRLAWPIWPHLYTLLVVMIGWVFFRADTLPGAIAFLRAMAGLTAAAPTPYTRRVVPDAGVVARARRRRDRIDAVGAGARARAARRRRAGWARAAAQHRRADRAARRCRS